jgi:diguanylate cyclase (GGDEF)-like protein
VVQAQRPRAALVSIDRIDHMALLLTLQFIALSLFPLYFTTLPAPMRQVHFYVYIALVLLIGGFMGNVYSVPIADGVAISGGNLCYGAFMMASVMFVWVERDTFILRHLVWLVIFVNIFKIVFAFLTQALLKADGVINTHNVPPDMFEASTYLIVVGGVLIVAELLILLFIFEVTKKRISSPLANGAIYILSFILVLVLDGFAFFFIAFGIGSEIVAIVFGGIPGKVLMATAFSIPLGLFMFWQRAAFVDYLESDVFRWRLLTSSSASLIREMARKDQEVQRGAAIFRNSSEGLAIVDGSGALLKANLAFQKMLGIDPEAKDVSNAFWYENKPLNLPKALGARWRNEVTFGRDQQSVGILSIAPVEGESGPRDTHVCSLVDISKQKRTQERLEHLVLHDQLTGLPNRRFLDRHLSGLQGEPQALVAVDLDRFRDINDSYGHGAGDRVLQVIGERLDALRTAHLEEGDVLCNVGADAFVFVIQSQDRGFVERVSEEVQHVVEQTISIMTAWRYSPPQRSA